MMSNRFVAAALQFFGFGDGLNGEGLDYEDDFDGLPPVDDSSSGYLPSAQRPQ